MVIRTKSNILFCLETGTENEKVVVIYQTPLNQAWDTDSFVMTWFLYDKNNHKCSFNSIFYKTAAYVVVMVVGEWSVWA